MSPDFNRFFERLALFHPLPWQRELPTATTHCPDCLIRVPTGFGKTLGVLAAWLWHRVERSDPRWPRRLVWCLPMRVLVEQTEFEVRAALRRISRLSIGESAPDKVGVHLLMGGTDAGDWQSHPEHCTVLIGTQDMLLSRALNRGYAAGRARWPMEFGLLSQDALWVMDEVQLMDVGLATSAQLQQFRREDEATGKSLRPVRTWFMSATLQRGWLQVSPDTREMAASLPLMSIPLADRIGTLWDGVAKPVRVEKVDSTRALAQLVAKEHLNGKRGAEGPTLVIANRVDDAVQLYGLLAKEKVLSGTDVRLVHSRFRPMDRASWRNTFLNRDACASGTDRIIIATQVVEAGIDISGGVLVTHLAPWPSLVQRVGRAARWGGHATIIVADHAPRDDKAAAPYDKASIDSARAALSFLVDASPRRLEEFEESHPELLPSLYPYAPGHLLLRHEIEELFDTTSDLSGADIDISRFIRSGDERDVHVFWREVPKGKSPADSVRPAREELCPVPAYLAQRWLFGDGERLKKGFSAWVWDYVDGAWRLTRRTDLYPGQSVLVDAGSGGYNPETGWNGQAQEPVPIMPLGPPLSANDADASEEDDALSVTSWQTVAGHGFLVGREAMAVGQVLCPDLAPLLEVAGRLHDFGKAHEAFRNCIRRNHAGWPNRLDLAKAPSDVWYPRNRLYMDDEGRQRRGFRHELASALALFALLARRAPEHVALLGPWRELFEKVGVETAETPSHESEPTGVESDLVSMSAEVFDLLAYLVCSHHGKVRMAWHAMPSDQGAADSRLLIRGVCDGDVLPATLVATRSGSFEELPSVALSLEAAAAGLNPVTGRGWA